jgi:hypothetical protein
MCDSKRTQNTELSSQETGENFKNVEPSFAKASARQALNIEVKRAQEHDFMGIGMGIGNVAVSVISYQ